MYALLATLTGPVRYGSRPGSRGGSLPQLTPSESLFRYQSGRVIALGRVMLVTCFLIALMLDRSEAAQEATGTFGLLVSYEVLAIVIAVATWRNWWLDARLAVATHALDMAVFTAIVFSSNGTTSPFFLFFVLPLALGRNPLELARDCADRDRSGGPAPHRRFPRRRQPELRDRTVRRAQRPPDDPVAAADLVRDAPALHPPSVSDRRMRGPPEARDRTRWSRRWRWREARPWPAAGALVIGPLGEESCDGIAVVHGERRVLSGCRSFARGPRRVGHAGRCPTRPRPDAGARGAFPVRRLRRVLEVEELSRLGLGKGLLVEVRTGTQQGWLVLWEVPTCRPTSSISGASSAAPSAAILDRYALLTRSNPARPRRERGCRSRATSTTASSSSSPAPHSGSKRSSAPPRAKPRLGAELDELKRLLVEEQGEVRGFVLALREGRELELAEAAAELRALAERLSQQWSVKCRVQVEGEDAAIPVRLQLDLQQLLREAVANAVRHGGADRIDVGARRQHGQLSLNVARQRVRVSQGQRRHRARTALAQGAGRAGQWLAPASNRSRARPIFIQHPSRSRRVTKVLLVDDHPMIGAALEMLLRDTDYELLGRARTAAEATSHLNRQKPDLAAARRAFARWLGAGRPSALVARPQAAEGDPGDSRHGRSPAPHRGRLAARGHRAQNVRSEPAAQVHGRGVRRESAGSIRRSPSAPARRRSGRPLPRR